MAKSWDINHELFNPTFSSMKIQVPGNSCQSSQIYEISIMIVDGKSQIHVPPWMVLSSPETSQTIRSTIHQPFCQPELSISAFDGSLVQAKHPIKQMETKRLLEHTRKLTFHRFTFLLPLSIDLVQLLFFPGFATGNHLLLPELFQPFGPQISKFDFRSADLGNQNHLSSLQFRQFFFTFVYLGWIMLKTSLTFQNQSK